jgi:hypothetical protein
MSPALATDLGHGVTGRIGFMKPVLGPAKFWWKKYYAKARTYPRARKIPLNPVISD